MEYAEQAQAVHKALNDSGLKTEITHYPPQAWDPYDRWYLTHDGGRGVTYDLQFNDVLPEGTLQWCFHNGAPHDNFDEDRMAWMLGVARNVCPITVSSVMPS